MGSGIMREEDLALDAALARAFEHEKDAETHARAVAEVAGAGAGGAGSAGRKQAAAAALSKPYRYVENYTLRGPKGQLESLEVLLQKRSRPNLTLSGTLVPASPPCAAAASSTGGSGKGRAPAPPAPIVLEDAPIEAWRVYSHPDPRYRGVWLQSKHAEYHLGAPAPEYAPLAADFAACVWHAVAVHLFVTDELGVEDAEDEQPGLEVLLQMMAGMAAAGEEGAGPARGPLDEAFAVTHAGQLYEILRDLHMSGSLEFMKDLRSLRSKAATKPRPRASSSPQTFTWPSSASVASSSASSSGHAKGKGKGPAAAKAAAGASGKRKAPAAAAKAKLYGRPPKAAASAAALSDDDDDDDEEEEEEESGAIAGGPPTKRGPATHSSNSSVASSSAAAAAEAGPGKKGAGSGAGGGKQRRKRGRGQQAAAGAGANDTAMEADAAMGPGAPLVPLEQLRLSDEVPSLLGRLAGHANRLARAMEEAHAPGAPPAARQAAQAAVERQLGEFGKILDALAAAPFEPLPYLLAGPQLGGGEALFHPLFELYRLLRRARFACGPAQKPAVAALRGRLVREFTDLVLRDVWYVQQGPTLAPRARRVKAGERAAWVQAKLGRKRGEQEAARAAAVAAYEGRKAAQDARRGERQGRRAAWEEGHAARKAARKEERRAAKAAEKEARRARKAAKAEAKAARVAAAAAATAAAAVEVAEAAAAADVGEGESKAGGVGGGGGEKRPAEGPAEEEEGAAGGANKKGLLYVPEESKCTLSPMRPPASASSVSSAGGSAP